MRPRMQYQPRSSAQLRCCLGFGGMISCMHGSSIRMYTLTASLSISTVRNLRQQVEDHSKQKATDWTSVSGKSRPPR